MLVLLLSAFPWYVAYAHLVRSCWSQIAVEGCCHGELDNIYASLALAEEKHGVKVDLLLICGDFQAVRNPSDLAGLACPPKYRAMHTFHKYYSG